MDAMKRPQLTALFLLLLTSPAITQPAPRFEVASIRPTPDDNAGSTIGLRVTGDHAYWGGLTLKDYIGEAYRLDPPQVIAPEWVNEQRYEISATLPAGSTREQVPEMLQAKMDTVAVQYGPRNRSQIACAQPMALNFARRIRFGMMMSIPKPPAVVTDRSNPHRAWEPLSSYVYRRIIIGRNNFPSI